MSARDLLAEKARIFRELHRGPALVVLPNAWDSASARAFERAGFAAIATTSGGVALSLGFEDHEKAPRAEMFAAVGRIARSVAVPVTADLEAGYGLSPGEVAREAIAAGAVGVNLEDTDHRTGALVDGEQQAETLAAFKKAARSQGVDLFLNARVDVFLRRAGTLEEQLADGIRRARLYADAGADCVYPLGIERGGEPAIEAFTREVHAPVNVRAADGGPSLTRLAELGVRRVTYASGLFRRMLDSVDAMAAELHAQIP